jgi:hypothetical protein
MVPASLSIFRFAAELSHRRQSPLSYRIVHG